MIFLDENEVQIASHPPPDFKVKWFLSVLERRSGQMDPPAFTPEFTEVREVFHNYLCSYILALLLQ